MSLYRPAVKLRCSKKKIFLNVPLYSFSVYKSKVYYFNHCFSYDAPKLWNGLPLEIRTAPIYVISFMFRKAT